VTFGRQRNISTGMIRNHEKEVKPLVSILVPTYNRRDFLPAALSSVVNQNYSNLEIFVIRDGGEDISDIVNSFNDPRIVFIDRDQNRGKAFSLNQALYRAKGKYVAYLDDDDLYYPNHIEVLVDALENKTDCEVAYSDLYRTYCRIQPDGSRVVLSKVADLRRDFDRFLMLCFNHTLHVCLMHRRDLLEKTGFYNENLNILIDWDLARRLVFFSDFYHVRKVTGEFYHPVGDSDRISVRHRKNPNEYIRNFLAIRTARPAKPWPKIKDVSIILTKGKPGGRLREAVTSICRRTFYPHQIYIPLARDHIERINIKTPNTIGVPINGKVSNEQSIDKALAECEGDFVAVVPVGFPIRDFWLEDSLCAMINNSADREAFELEDSTDKLWAVVLRKEDLVNARKNFSNLPLRQSLQAAGITIRRVLPEEIPFQLDQLLQQGRTAEKDGNWLKAARTFEYIAEHYQNEVWMKGLAANAFFKAGQYDRAVELVGRVNRKQPTVETLLLEAKLNREKKNHKSAIELLEKAEQILQYPLCGTGLRGFTLKEKV